ncbi:hypothetical protein J2W76_003174 [Methylorubrum zatmanii]|nr:hypothetical protein [Methylorubrum zatmanii]MCP1553457.1 hypothetical protein [Methylorubrum extorquens]MCP1580231.1 hypothetical protein [Methylorubrum extorquens]
MGLLRAGLISVFQRFIDVHALQAARGPAPEPGSVVSRESEKVTVRC